MQVINTYSCMSPACWLRPTLTGSGITGCSAPCLAHPWTTKCSPIPPHGVSLLQTVIPRVHSWGWAQPALSFFFGPSSMVWEQSKHIVNHIFGSAWGCGGGSSSAWGCDGGTAHPQPRLLLALNHLCRVGAALRSTGFRTQEQSCLLPL